jgi:hypothetical protein
LHRLGMLPGAHVWRQFSVRGARSGHASEGGGHGVRDSRLRSVGLLRGSSGVWRCIQLQWSGNVYAGEGGVDSVRDADLQKL